MKRRLVLLLPILGFAFLTLLYEACVWLMAYLNIAFPGALVAMLVLYLLLESKLLPLWIVESACRRLLEFMPLYFVPFLVGIMAYREILAGKILGIFGSVIVSAAITIALTGLAVEFIARKRSKTGDEA
jgi:holin-like protein